MPERSFRSAVKEMPVTDSMKVALDKLPPIMLNDLGPTEEAAVAMWR